MKCEWTDQRSQSHDFVLIRGELNSTAPNRPTEHTTLPIGAECQLGPDRFQLLRQTGRTVQFLSLAPVPSLDLNQFGASDITFEIHQAWQNSPQDRFSEETPLLITASQTYLPAALDLAHRLSATHTLRVLLTSNIGFPFAIQPARFLWPDFPAEAMGSSRLLEDWGIPNRLLSTEFMPGCFEGSLTDLTAEWSLPTDWQICALDHALAGV